jgi:hypothetical protein
LSDAADQVSVMLLVVLDVTDRFETVVGAWASPLAAMADLMVTPPLDTQPKRTTAITPSSVRRWRLRGAAPHMGDYIDSA